MRGRQHGERLDQLGMQGGERPGDGSAPVVAHEMETIEAGTVGECDDIADEIVDAVVGDAPGSSPR